MRPPAFPGTYPLHPKRSRVYRFADAVLGSRLLFYLRRSVIPQLPHCTSALFLLWLSPLRGQALPAAPLPQSPSMAAPQRVGGCRLTGEVLSNGAMVSGAQLRLSSAGETLQTKSDDSGRFTFLGLDPAPYTLTATLPGFTTVTQHVELQPGETLDLPPIELTLSTVSITVDALTPEQLALEQLHTEEHQRLVGVLPNFFVSYNWTAPPLTAGQKFRLSTRNALDPGNLALVGTVAGVQQAANAFPGYGQGAAGYGRRYGADLGNLVIGTYMGGAVLPSLFHQDPRYFYKGTGTKRSRVLYALSRAVITRGDNGHDQPNFAGVLGDLSAGAISNLYYPASDRQGATIFLENSILAIAGDAMNDLVQEFFFSRFTSDTRNKKSKQHP